MSASRQVLASLPCALSRMRRSTAASSVGGRREPYGVQDGAPVGGELVDGGEQVGREVLRRRGQQDPHSGGAGGQQEPGERGLQAGGHAIATRSGSVA